MSDKAVSSKKPQEDLFNQYLSWHDMEKATGFKEAWKAMDLAKIEEILYTHGCDVEFGWELTYCTHRPRTSNQPVNSVRFEFVERKDKEWQNSGCMAVEDIINSCGDSSLRLELKGMSRRDQNTANACKHAASEKPDI